jgi:hypothetical protein
VHDGNRVRAIRAAVGVLVAQRGEQVLGVVEL